MRPVLLAALFAAGCGTSSAQGGNPAPEGAAGGAGVTSSSGGTLNDGGDASSGGNPSAPSGGAGNTAAGGSGTTTARGGGQQTTYTVPEYSPSCEDEACTPEEECMQGPDGTYCVHPCPGQPCPPGTNGESFCTKTGGVICG